MITIDQLLMKLERVKKAGKDQWKALCPSHDDHNPSLSIRERPGEIDIYCFAGCTRDQICAALGIEPKDLLSDNGQKRQRRRIVATYDYCDENGKLLFQVVRYHPKDFRQRRPGKRGGWIWNTKGVTKVLYRLPELLEASEIWACEGEKDCDNLHRLGLVATTIPGGAMKLRACLKSNPEFLEPLRGKKVYIIPDNDPVGKRHAEQLANELTGIAKEIRVVELAGLPGGDVSDFIKQHEDAKEQLLALAKKTKSYTPKPHLDDPFDSGKEEKPTQSEILLGLCGDVELFHTPNQEAYAKLEVESHFEIWPVRSKGFKQWLCRKFYVNQHKAPNSQALNDALNVLEGKALFEGEEREVYVRVAGYEGKIYLDLCNDSWQVIEVSKNGWRVLDESPVCFRRTRGIRQLPTPSKDGNIKPLRELLNLGDEGSFKLIVGWLLQSLTPAPPYPVLVLYGEQGSSKSTASRFLRSLVDPSSIPLRTTPRNEHDLVIAANNSWVLAFDNFSGLPGWLSDAFCRLSTGGGMSTRQLYSDNEEVLFCATRPLIINGITDIIHRHDLADRAIFVTLPPIPEDKRLKEADLNAKFHELRPIIFGGLLDAVSMALKRKESIQLERLPRMADFATWVSAAEPKLPWNDGEFMQAYTENRRDIVAKSVEADLVAGELTKWFKGKDSWQGTPSQLLEELEGHANERTTRQKGWPTTPTWLTRNLKRSTSFLRQLGIEIVFLKSGDRSIQIERVSNLPPIAPIPSNRNDSRGLGMDGKRTLKDGKNFSVQNTARRKPAPQASLDTKDAMDTKKQLLSKPSNRKKIKPLFDVYGDYIEGEL